MTPDDTAPGRDADAIESDIRHTQDQLGETVDRLEEKLNPREISRSIVGDEKVDVAREALEMTKQNPFPVVLIAVGLIWLLATSRSPLVRRFTARLTGDRSDVGTSLASRSRAAGPMPA